MQKNADSSPKDGAKNDKMQAEIEKKSHNHN